MLLNTVSATVLYQCIPPGQGMFPFFRLMMFRVANSGKAPTNFYKIKDQLGTTFDVLNLSLAVVVYIARVHRN